MLMDRIDDRSARIAVIGVGYVGLPLAVRLATLGFEVTGVDIDEETLELVAAGRSTITDLPDDLLRQAVDSGRLNSVRVERDSAKNPPEVLARLFGIDVFIICVHTPLRSQPLTRREVREPDTNWIAQSANLLRLLYRAQAAAGSAPRERLVVLESTTNPGTTRELLAAALQEYQDTTTTYLAYSPERRNPGQTVDEMFSTPRIVGGLDPMSLTIAERLYATAFDRVHPVSGLETAEFVKLLENAFRFLSIGFANEMARAASLFDVDIWEAIAAARTKGFGFELCVPGLIGGHCIPVDPHYLIRAVIDRGANLPLLQSAVDTHSRFRGQALRLVDRLLALQGKEIAGAHILFWGVAYKSDVGDTRDSGAIELMSLLHAYGARMSFWDPVRAALPRKSPVHADHPYEEWRALADTAALPSRSSQPLSMRFEPAEVEHPEDVDARQAFYEGFDAVVIATDHREFRDAYADLIAAGAPIADLRNAIPRWLDTLPEPERTQVRKPLSAKSRFLLLGRD